MGQAVNSTSAARSESARLLRSASLLNKSEAHRTLRPQASSNMAECTAWLPYTLGGRQGGVETPGLLNSSVNSRTKGFVEKWIEKGYGMCYKRAKSSTVKRSCTR